MSYERFSDELQRDVKTNVFALVGIEAGINDKEFKKAPPMDWFLVQSICKELLMSSVESEDLTVQNGTTKLFEFCVYSVLDMCRILKADIDKLKDDKKIKFIPYDMGVSNIWSKCNIANMYDFLNTLSNYHIDAEFLSHEYTFATGDKELDNLLNSLMADKSRITKIDAYVMSCIITKNEHYVSDSFLNAYKAFRLEFVSEDKMVDTLTGSLLNILVYLSNHDKCLHKFDKDLKRYFDGENDIKSLLDLRFTEAVNIMKNN